MTYLYKKNCEIRDDAIPPEGMRRIAFQVEYNGSAFYGFQRQKNTEKTIQEALERALTRVANEPITLVCAGRTDALVHATAQVIHFDTFAERTEVNWVRGVNSYLPTTIRVIEAQDVGFKFHARFSALSRTYSYLMNASHIKPTHLDTLVTWVRLYNENQTGLNLDAMTKAANHLKGHHDFTSFQASGCQAKTATRTMIDIYFEPRGKIVCLNITANAFLQHMVRNIMGLLIKVGKGKIDPDYACTLLTLKDRTKAPDTASPDGLYFVSVSYPDALNIRFKPRKPMLL